MNHVTTGKSLGDMSAELRQINIEKGWRPAGGGPGDNTFGDYLALLHSEISEALEAYREHRLEDATAFIPAGDMPVMERIRVEHKNPPKPEGVGSELADVLIRFLDMCDVFGLTPFDMDCELADVEPLDIPDSVRSFGDHIDWLHKRAAAVEPTWLTVNRLLARFLRALVAVAERYGVDLAAEYRRKIAFNRTRSFRHGNKGL